VSNPLPKKVGAALRAALGSILRNQGRRRRTAPTLGALLVLSLPAHAADWAPCLTATATWDDNLTNAARATDRLGALRLDTSVSVEHRTGLTSALALLSGAQLDLASVPRFDGLDRLALGPTLALRYKAGLGPLAPVVTLRAAATLSAARESGRAGPAANLALTVSRRLDEATQLRAGVELSRLAARQSVFARTGLEGFVELAHDLDPVWRVMLTARWRRGDVLSYATPPRPDLVALARVRTANDTFSRPFVAYSIDSHSLTGAITFSRALDDRTSLNFAFEWRETTRDPLVYVNRLVSLGVAHQF